jgi:hypothetical protein
VRLRRAGMLHPLPALCRRKEGDVLTSSDIRVHDPNAELCGDLRRRVHEQLLRRMRASSRLQNLRDEPCLFILEDE